jgi:hypothetical protein
MYLMFGGQCCICSVSGMKDGGVIGICKSVACSRNIWVAGTKQRTAMAVQTRTSPASVIQSTNKLIATRVHTGRINIVKVCGYQVAKI